MKSNRLIATTLVSVLLSSACMHRRPHGSDTATAMAVYPPITQFDTEAGVEKSLFDSFPYPYEWASTKSDIADKAFEKARQIRAKDASSRYSTTNSGYKDTSACGSSGACVGTSAHNLYAGSIPADAADSLAEAAAHYMQIVSLFDGTRPGVDYEDLVLQKKCGGVPLLPQEYGLCREILRASRLYSFAIGHLDQYFASLESTPEDFKKYLRYYALADSLLGRVDTVRTEAARGWVASNFGYLDATDVQSVPYLAIIADPSTLTRKVQEALSSYKSLAERMLNDRIALIQSQIESMNAVSLKNEIKYRQNEVLNQQDITSSTFAVDKTDFDFNNEQAQKIIKQIEDGTRKFSLEMRSIMGQPGATSEALRSALQIYPNHPFNGTSDTIDLGSLGPQNLLVDVSATATQIRSNGIYNNNLPAGIIDGTATGFKGFHKVIGKVTQAAVTGVSHAAQSVNAAGKDIRQIARDNKDIVAGALVGGLIGGPVGMVEGALAAEAVRGAGVSTNANSLMREGLNAVGGGALSAAEMALPGGLALHNPVAMANEMANRLTDLKYPQMATHIFRQFANVGGYFISRSVGASVGASAGESSGKSIGISVGVSAGVNFIGEASTSGGASAGVNNGKSSGASIGKNSGVSMQVGFYHPNSYEVNSPVGMLLAELTCGDTPKARYAVGLSNFLQVDTANCQNPKLRFVINDNIAGASAVCITQDKLTEMNKHGIEVTPAERACASDTPVPVTVRVLQSQQVAYQTLYSILQSADIREAIEDAAYSSDPTGSAWRIFVQRAHSSGVTDEFIGRFQPVVEHYVSVQSDKKALAGIALAQQKLATRHESSIRQQALLHVQAQLLTDQNLKTMSIGELRNAHKALVANQLAIDTAFAEFYLARLTRWIGLYRASVKYHRNKDIEDPVTSLKTQMDETISSALDKAAENGPDAGKAELRAYNDSLIVSRFIDVQGDTEWIHSIQTQPVINHCSVSFGDLITGGSQKNKPRALFVLPDEHNREYPSNLLTAATDGANYDAQIPQSMQFSGGGDPEAFAGYFRIRINTDPSPTNTVPYDYPPMTTGGSVGVNVRPKLRCAVPKQASLAKLLGIAFTYSLSSNQSTRRAIAVEHSPLMFTYAPGDGDSQGAPGERRLFRIIDWSSVTADLMPDPPNKISMINMVREAEAINNGCLTGDQQTWTNRSCYTFLLGNNILPSNGSRDFRVNFFNSYIGGDWSIYVPYTPDQTNAWSKMRTDLTKMTMHMFFVADDSVH